MSSDSSCIELNAEGLLANDMRERSPNFRYSATEIHGICCFSSRIVRGLARAQRAYPVKPGLIRVNAPLRPV